MRIGRMMGAGRPETLDDLVAQAQAAEAAGLSSVWLANIFGFDAIGALAVVGRETSRVELGTAVVPTYPRHPVTMAQQALTTQAASGGRFVLGLGLSHQIVIETMLGLSYSRRASHMREYLEVIEPLLRGEPASFSGDEYRVQAGLRVPGADPVPVLVAALGPAMLKLAGSRTAGTITWMTGPKTLETHTIPGINAAAEAAGRAAPRVVAGLPIALTNDPAAAREIAAKVFEVYGGLPSYRAMLDREGAAGPADVAIVGDESALESQLGQLVDIGVTDFLASPIPADPGAVERTLAFLANRS